MDRLIALRQLISENHLDGFLVTDSDYHYTFYSLAHHDRRINWITQCQAQCGMALITLNHGAIFESPPNYHLLARKEMDIRSWSIVSSLFEWIQQYGSKIGTIGYDPHRTPMFIIRRLTLLSSEQCRFQAISSSTNWIDSISDHETLPVPPILTSIWSLDEKRFAGQTSEEKIEILRKTYLSDNKESFTLVTTAMDEIAWLLNLRANDMQCNPLFYSFMVISKSQLVLFTNNPHQSLPYDIRSYDDFLPFLSTLNTHRVWIDERSCMSIIEALPSPPVRISRSPIQQMKEIKNQVELEGFRQCHYRDCEAVCQTFEWLEQSIEQNLVISELDVIKYVEYRQREKDHFISIAFDTISAVGSNTALIEYAPSSTDGGMKIGYDLYYLDAGANYLDGTTDMTRTIHLGQPAQKQIECYTLLLRGILAVEMTCFHRKSIVTGYRIDSLLQQYFNAHYYSGEHISFGHGVAHGQGIIEGGVAISDNSSLSHVVLIKPGMVLTLEPGIYFENQWGIRIENVYTVEEDGPDWMRFVPLTLIPYCHKMINFDLLSKAELRWIDQYHHRCRKHVNGGTWMENEIRKFYL